MSGTLILVESPNKAKKIQGYLGRGFTVKATIGHIADLPEKSYGVDLETFAETYEARNPGLVAQLRQLVKVHDRVLLASDPDREGEAIAWHVARELRLGFSAAQRIEFHEITERAIQAAVQSPRPIDMARVDAQRSRRVLDRIVGFDVSKEICWPAGAQSAGRVQTPALHMLCERERAILKFVVVTYWTVEAAYTEGLVAFVPAAPTDATGPADGPDETTEPETPVEGSPRLVPRKFLSRAEAEAVIAQAQPHAHRVADLARRRAFKKPDPPYTTSTMQQDASRKLRLSAKAAATHAQALFEAGYISYHRTDSIRVSEDAVAMARAFIAQDHPEALPATPPKARAKAGAQDAHEAIRPTHLTGDTAPPSGTADLYRLIKARFLASQCKPAEIERTTVQIAAGPVQFVAEGSVLLDKGYLVYWGPYAKQEDELLPPLQTGQALHVDAYRAPEKKTTPPSRYDTGALIKKLEVSGVGRPSTFASIIDTLLKRNYIAEITAGRGKTLLQPTAFGLQVDALMTAAMPDLVSDEYTAAMESALDRMAAQSGDDRPTYLRTWYAAFRTAMAAGLPHAEAFRTAHGMRPRAGGGGAEDTDQPCDRCGTANYRKIARKVGRGMFLACPACKMMRDLKAKVKPNGCPTCGSALIERRGKDKGTTFFGCVRYGADDRPCAYIERADGKVGGQFVRTETDKQCPKCKAHRLLQFTPRVATAADPGFYACPDTGCKFKLTVGSRRRPAACPECGGVVLERRRKPTETQKRAGTPGASFWSCARYPDCKYAADFSPTA